jgi:PleD family two-component response regulator
VAEQGRDGTTFEELYRAADDALRLAKIRGRGRVVPAGAIALADPAEPSPGMR